MKSRSPRLLIFLTIFIDLLGFGIVIPILGPIGKQYAGGESHTVLIGVYMASYSLFQMIFSPFIGRLSDRVGRRPVILLSLFGSATSYLMFGFARSYTVLLLARIFAGICAANLSAAQAYLADVSEPEKRTAAMGLVGMAFGLGFTFGPIFGGLLSWLGTEQFPELARHTLPGLGAAAICYANFVWAMFALPESLPAERRGKPEVRAKRFATAHEFMDSIGHRIIGPMVAVFFIATFAFANFESMLSIYLEDDGRMSFELPQIYGIFIYVGLVLAFMHGYVARKLSKFVPEAVLVIVGMAAQGVSLVLFPLSASVPWILFTLTILCFGQGIGVPSLLALVSHSTSAARQGQVMGVAQSASSLGRILGPLVATAIWGWVGLSWPFVFGGLAMFAAVAMAVVTRRRLIHRPLPGMEKPEEAATG